MCIPPEGQALAMSSNVNHGGWGFEVICPELTFAVQLKK
jgi:hypothetical protein